MDSQQFIRIPSTSDIQDVVDLIENLPSDLASLGISVSTGRVVDFRVKEHLSNPADPTESPLLYPVNIEKGMFTWPILGKKPQSIDPKLNSLLLPNETYVITKRFTSKEERRRIVAGIWDPKVTTSTTVGFENHLNVFHIANRGLPRNIALGLLYWLNGTLIDDYFRIFSGHTQVNAGDLRSLPFPAKSSLEAIGRGAKLPLPTQDEIDKKINEVLAMKVEVA
jgi:adenine-specific DNA-methyltransferase